MLKLELDVKLEIWTTLRNTPNYIRTFMQRNYKTIWLVADVINACNKCCQCSVIYSNQILYPKWMSYGKS